MKFPPARVTLLVLFTVIAVTAWWWAPPVWERTWYGVRGSELTQSQGEWLVFSTTYVRLTGRAVDSAGWYLDGGMRQHVTYQDLNGRADDYTRQNARRMSPPPPTGSFDAVDTYWTPNGEIAQQHFFDRDTNQLSKIDEPPWFEARARTTPDLPPWLKAWGDAERSRRSAER